jgi:hypothetical protein
MLTKRMIGNLRKQDEKSWLAAIAELEVAQLLGDAGIEFCAEPAGRVGKYGELQIVSDPPVFVEVKTLFDDPDGTLRERVRRKLWHSTRLVGRQLGITGVVEFVHIRRLTDFSQRSFERRLREVATPGVGVRNDVFTDKSGFEIEFRYRPQPSLRSLAPVGPWHFSWGTDTNPYERAIRRALKQLPPDRPNLLILRSYIEFPLDAEDVSELTARCFRPGGRTRISALAFMRDSGGSRTLALHLNPFARLPLPNIFEYAPQVTVER